jgi:hypothetical protein
MKQEKGNKKAFGDQQDVMFVDSVQASVYSFFF